MAHLHRDLAAGTMLMFLYPATKRYGIDGVSALSAIVAVVDFVISASLVGRLVAAPWGAYARMLIPTSLIAAIACGAARWVYPAMPFPKTALNLASTGLLLVLIYATLAWAMDRELRDTARSLTRQALNLYRQRALGGRPATALEEKRGVGCEDL